MHVVPRVLNVVSMNWRRTLREEVVEDVVEGIVTGLAKRRESSPGPSDPAGRDMGERRGIEMWSRNYQRSMVHPKVLPTEMYKSPSSNMRN